MAYNNLLDKVHKLDPKYDPLKEFNPFCKKIDYLKEKIDEVMYDLMDEPEKLQITSGQEIRKEPLKLTAQQRPLSKPPQQRPRVQKSASPLKREPKEERPIYMPPRGRVIYRRVRDESDSEEEEEIKRKGKGIMKQ